jgi:hypothetical protein
MEWDARIVKEPGKLATKFLLDYVLHPLKGNLFFGRRGSSGVFFRGSLVPKVFESVLPLRLLCRRFLFGFVLLNEFLPQFPEGLLLGVSIFDIIARARTGGNIHTATTDVVEQSLRASTFQQFGAKLTQKIFGRFAGSGFV